MKSKEPLALIEQLVMLLVFALAAALCLQMFVLSSQVSRRCEARDHAVLVVQNVAESLKICHGDLEEHTQLVGGISDGMQWQISYDSDWEETLSEQAAYQVCVSPVQDDQLMLGTAEISAQTKEGDILFQVTVSWQEDTK